MKEYEDILILRGHNITDEKILNHILDDLDFNYDFVVVMLNSRFESKFDKPILLDTYYHLLKHELRLKITHQTLNTSISLEFH